MDTKGPSEPVRISLLAVPDVYMSSLSGFYDTFGIASDLSGGRGRFRVEIVARRERLESRASGMPIVPHRTLDQVADSDVVIVPTTVGNGADWVEGTHPGATRWLADMYARGSTVCSACSGALLLAEAGVLDGQEITTHWDLAPTFRDRFPSVRLRLEHELVTSGRDGRIVTSGASAAWHDLALYLIARDGDEDIAWQVGYADSSAFHRLFKRITHVTPGAYRRKMKVRVPYGDVDR